MHQKKLDTDTVVQEK